MLKSKSFWIVMIVVIAGVLLAYSNSGKTYVGTTDILVLPKSDRIVRNVEQIIGDAEQIPRSLKFYDIMLQENSNIEDQFASLPDAERKASWNAMLRVDQKKKSGVLSVAISSQNQLQASILSQQTAKDIAVVLSRYYDIKTDLDIRLIDGPIVAQTGRPLTLGLTGIGIIIGIIAGVIAYLIFGYARESLAMPKSKIAFPSYVADKTLEKAGFAPDAKTETKAEIEQIIFAQPAVKKETPAEGEKKAFAPENLPVGSDFVISSLRRAEKTSKKDEETADFKSHEATEEEIRARLNKLLGGKM
ncbi:MAG: hypothetical protein WCX17_04650 [Parcubacteria group bacterium]